MTDPRTSLVGSRWGRWLVLRDPMPEAGWSRRVATRCTCGTITTVSVRALLSGMSTRCKVAGRHTRDGDAVAP